jgi:hypothetical protein
VFFESFGPSLEYLLLSFALSLLRDSGTAHAGTINELPFLAPLSLQGGGADHVEFVSQTKADTGASDEPAHPHKPCMQPQQQHVSNEGLN